MKYKRQHRASLSQATNQCNILCQGSEDQRIPKMTHRFRIKYQFTGERGVGVMAVHNLPYPLQNFFRLPTLCDRKCSAYATPTTFNFFYTLQYLLKVKDPNNFSSSIKTKHSLNFIILRLTRKLI